MADHDAELDAIVTTLAAAGHVERSRTGGSKPAMRLTLEGARVAPWKVMSHDPDGLSMHCGRATGRPTLDPLAIRSAPWLRPLGGS
jgi:hypothetical protein